MPKLPPSRCLPLLIFLRPQSWRDQSDPNEMASHRKAPPPWAALWNSNAYAIRRKCEKKIEINRNSFQIIYLQFDESEFAHSLRGELCHARDSGAVRIASLARRSAAFYFFERFFAAHGRYSGRLPALSRVSGTLCALDALGTSQSGELPMADDCIAICANSRPVRKTSKIWCKRRRMAVWALAAHGPLFRRRGFHHTGSLPRLLNLKPLRINPPRPARRLCTWRPPRVWPRAACPR